MSVHARSRRRFVALVIGVLALGLTACGCTSHTHHPADKFGTVTGFVGFVGDTLEAGPGQRLPARGAKIEMMTSSGLTTTAIVGEDGRYAVQVVPGEYTMYVLHLGPCPTPSAVVTGGKTTTVNVTCYFHSRAAALGHAVRISARPRSQRQIRLSICVIRTTLDCVDEGMVVEWHNDEGWGVIESARTPGGCWVLFPAVRMPDTDR